MALITTKKKNPLAGHSWRKKMAIFDKIGHKKFKLYFWSKFFISKFLSVRAFTNVKSGRKFQLESG